MDIAPPRPAGAEPGAQPVKRRSAHAKAIQPPAQPMPQPKPAPRPVAPPPAPAVRPVAAAPAPRAAGQRPMRQAQSGADQQYADEVAAEPREARGGGWRTALQVMIGLLVIAGVATAIVVLYIRYYQ